jgi:hypothetical protein
MILKACYCLKFEYLKDVTMANFRRIKPLFHAMGAIANNIRYGFLIVVICNPKMLPPNYDMDNSL